MTRSVVATGKIEPITKVEIKSKANGIIERLAVDVDHRVRGRADPGRARQGEPATPGCARRAPTSKRRARRCTAAEAQARKNEIEAEAPDVAFAKSMHDRAQSLSDQKLISQEALDQARTNHDQALNRQRAAQSQLLVSRAKIEEARAQVAQAQAAAERAEEELANSTIKAPIRGTVLSRDVEIGSPVSSILNLGANATLVMTLGDIAQVFVRGKVDEADIGFVRLGMPARITTESFRDKVFTGKVTQISPIGVEKDNVTTFEIEVSIENPGQELKANMTANAEVILEERPNALIVPEAAVTYDDQKAAFVELADPGRRRRPPQGAGEARHRQRHPDAGASRGSRPATRSSFPASA